MARSDRRCFFCRPLAALGSPRLSRSPGETSGCIFKFSELLNIRGLGEAASIHQVPESFQNLGLTFCRVMAKDWQAERVLRSRLGDPRVWPDGAGCVRVLGRALVENSNAMTDRTISNLECLECAVPNSEDVHIPTHGHRGRIGDASAVNFGFWRNRSVFEVQRRQALGGLDWVLWVPSKKTLGR